jgi:hypothetical protein
LTVTARDYTKTIKFWPCGMVDAMSKIARPSNHHSRSIDSGGPIP